MSAELGVGSARAVPTRETLRILVACVLGTPPAASDVASWAALHALAASERCLSLVWLRSGDWLRRYAPPEVLSRWRADVVRLDDGSRRQFGAVAALVRTLDAEGIAPVVLKGAPLSLRAHGDPFVRHSADADLYVRVADRARAHTVLVAAGWRHDGGESPGEAFYRNDHDGLHLVLEIHSSLTEDLLISHVVLPDPAATITVIGQTAVPAFDGPYLPVYLALHLAKHTSAPLLWLADFKALWESLTVAEREAAFTSAQRVRASRYLQWCVDRCAALERIARGNEAALHVCGGSTGLFREPHAALLNARLSATPTAASGILMRWVTQRMRAIGRAPHAATGRLAWMDRLAGGRALLAAPPGTTQVPDATRVVAASAPASLRLVRDVIAHGGRTWLVARGSSMWPTIGSGARICVEPLGDLPLRVGDVVLAEVAAGEPVVHRVHAMDEATVTLRGDNMPHADRPIPRAQVIARVSRFEADGREREVAARRPAALAYYAQRVRRRVGALLQAREVRA